MGIHARTLRVHNYRNLSDLSLDLDPGVTILVGRNAVGKTNLVEALQMLTAGQSFRKPTPRELVREGSETGRIELSLEGDGRLLEMGCDLSMRKRSFTRNGKRVNSAGVRGVLPSVLFCPDDLDMVKRSASVRRAALDDFGMQLNEQYARLVGAYERTVEQRNNLLKERFIDPALLSVWDDALVSTGAALMAHRAALLARIRGHFVGVHAAIAPTEAADIDYAPSFDLEAPASTLDRRALEEGLAHALASSREDERRRGVTLVGPHRDEVLFSIDGREARSFGSQGQQRSLVLAWKIAEVEVTGDILGHAPLLLLDDVMSELDAQRRSSIVSFIAGDIQTVITTTNLGYFEEQVLERAKVVRIDAA